MRAGKKTLTSALTKVGWNSDRLANKSKINLTNFLSLHHHTNFTNKLKLKQAAQDVVDETVRLLQANLSPSQLPSDFEPLAPVRNTAN